MTNEKKKPEIRFAGYKDEWTIRKFSDAFDILSNNTLSRDKLNYKGGSTMNIHYGDILTVFSEYLDVSKSDLPFISDEEISEKLKGTVLKDGDIVIADTAEDETVGKCVEVGNSNGKKVVSGLHTMPCRPKDKFASKYMGYYLNSSRYHDNLLPLMQGVKVMSLSRTGVQDTDIIVSESYDEQQKIGCFLYSIDELIRNENQKYEKLIIMKNSLLVKMFPRNGAKVPEIRFSGFTDDWEQRKFSQVFDGLQNNTLSRAELNYENGTVKNVHYGDVLIKFGDCIDASETELPYITDEAKVDKFKGSFLQDGDVVIADTAEDETVGKCTEIQGSEGMKLLSGLHTIPCRPKEKFGAKFLGYYMNSSAYHNQLIPLMQGIKVTSISKSALQDTEMIIPKSKEEQTKIGEYFSNLDNLITLHQHKLDKLQNIKNACMKKMFV